MPPRPNTMAYEVADFFYAVFIKTITKLLGQHINTC